MEATVTETKPATNYRSVTRDGLKGLIKIQNVLLDFAAEQNAIAFKMVRERIKADESAPATALIDSVEEIFEGVVAMQKSILDLGAERVEGEPETDDVEPAPAKEKRSMPKLPFAELLRKNFESTVEAQREILALVEKQGKLGVEAADEFTRFTAGKTLKHLAAKAKESVDNVIETQSKLVALAARRGKDSIETLANQDKSLVSKDLARHAEEGIDNLRRAQEKLLEIAHDLNSRAYGQPVEADDEAAEASKFAQRLNSGIERAIKAQNELLDAGLRAVNRKPAQS